MNEWTSNKGEWSEAYTFLKLLVDPTLQSADGSLSPLDGNYYLVKEIIWKSNDLERRFVPKSGSYRNPQNESLAVSAEEIREALDPILKSISAGSGAFSIPLVQDLYSRMGLPSFKMASSKKVDITLTIPSLGGVQERELGFSIKSQLGSESTLLNASASTNIAFTVGGFDAVSALGDKGLGHYRTNLDKIRDSSRTLTYARYASTVFMENLRNFSSDFPEFYAELVRTYVSGESNTRKISELVTISSANGLEENQRRYQTKSFLRAIALGLVPNTEWQGKLSGYGGYIIVKKSGELYCLHLDNDDDFRDYLFENTGFTTPKNELFHSPEIVDDNFILFLNAQIRFLA